jgi:hypothetical protein
MRNGIQRRRPASRPDTGPTFVIERFGWGAPDRLEVAGIFTGLAIEPRGAAILTVEGEDGAHRLPAVDGEAGPPADGARWAAEFAWLEAPVAFDRARLELGTSLAVELPAPGAAADGPLAVEVLDEPEDDEQAPAAATTPAAERLRLETELLEQAERLAEARDAAQRAESALQRAAADLAGEREGRAADAERFREGLAKVRDSAEDALIAAAAARAHDEELMTAEIADLHARIAGLEPMGAERDAARLELEEARRELDAVRAELDGARDALSSARTDAQALVDRLAGRR